jgi:hypothetical protein
MLAYCHAPQLHTDRFLAYVFARRLDVSAEGGPLPGGHVGLQLRRHATGGQRLHVKGLHEVLE